MAHSILQTTTKKLNLYVYFLLKVSLHPEVAHKKYLCNWSVNFKTQART